MNPSRKQLRPDIDILSERTFTYRGFRIDEVHMKLKVHGVDMVKVLWARHPWEKAEVDGQESFLYQVDIIPQLYPETVPTSILKIKALFDRENPEDGKQGNVIVTN